MRESVARRRVRSRAREARPRERMLYVLQVEVSISLESRSEKRDEGTRRGGKGEGDVPVVETSRTETTLNDLETPAPAEDEVVERNADVLVEDFEVTLGGVVVAKLLTGRGRAVSVLE